jgi:hypothetical protein
MRDRHPTHRELPAVRRDERELGGAAPAQATATATATATEEASGRFQVELLYREPTYAAARGIALRDYRALYLIEATDAAAAELQARRAFAEAARLASVGWVREIVAATVQRAP